MDAPVFNLSVKIFDPPYSFHISDFSQTTLGRELIIV
jgi:hypothetical protein